MRNAKLWSVLLAAVLLCACIAGVLFTGASASEGTRYELNVGGEGEYATVEAALATLADKTKETWEDDAYLVININGEVSSEAAANNLLFGQQTIWVADGKMLPITITGAGSLILPAVEIANANNITFNGLDMPISAVAVKLYAGSASLTFDACALGTSTTYRLYADNFTANAYGNWDEADYLTLKDDDGHIKTKLTIKNMDAADFVTKHTSGSVNFSAGYQVAAVGSSTDFEAPIKNETEEVVYSISANNTKAELVLDGVTTATTYVRSGANPVAKSILTLENSTITYLRAAGWEMGSKDNSSYGNQSYTGDVEINMTGSTYKSYGRMLYACSLLADTEEDGVADGDYTVNISNSTYSASSNDNNYIQPCYSGCTIEGDYDITYEDMTFYRCYTNNGDNGTVKGDYNATVKRVSSCTFYGGFNTVYGSVTNDIDDLQVELTTNSAGTGVLDGIKFFQGSTVGNSEGYTGDHPEAVGNITNIVKNSNFSFSSTVGAKSLYVYMTFGPFAATASVSGVIRNELDNVHVSDGTEAILRVVAGNYSKGTIGENINIVNNCSFDDAFYGGPYNISSTGGSVTNDITDTSFDNFYGLGSGTITGTLQNTLKGNCSATTYILCGGSGNVLRAEDCTDEYIVVNEINGGTYKGVWGGFGRDSSTPFTDNIKNTINGGTFNVYNKDKTSGFAGGTRNAEHSAGKVDTYIYGGTFNSVVYGGQSPNDSAYSDANGASCNTYICGGTFNNAIVADSCYGASYNTATLTITETEGKSLEIYGEVADCTSFNGNGGTVKIGKDTVINAAAANGIVTFEQTEGWLAHDYFTAPASSIEVAVISEDVFGEHEYKSDVLVLRGKGQTIHGATLILDDRLNVRILFDTVDMAEYGEEFTFTAEMGGITLGTVAETYEYKGVTYASYIVKAIGLSQFTTDITITGATFGERTFTVVGMAESGIEASAEGSAEEKLFKSIVNLGMVAANTTEKPKYDLSAEDVPDHETKLDRLEEGAIVFDSKALLMSDAVGIRLYGKAAAGVVTKESIVVNVNGKDVTGYCVMDEPETGVFTVDMYVTASMMTSPLNIVITDAATGETTTYLSYTEKLDSFAEKCSVDGNALATQLLIYIQAANAYKNA